MKKIIGIDLGGTSIKFAISTQEGMILKKWSIKTNTENNGKNIVPNIVQSILTKLEEENLSTNDILGIGLGTPGAINYKNGSVSSAFNLGWKEEQFIAKEILQALNLQVFLENDANCAALGEQFLGAGKKAKNIAFITLGTGVGGGIVNEGKLIRGINGAGGEIGYMIVDLQGEKCTCGNTGCLETICSATGIIKTAKKIAKNFKGSSLLIDKIDTITSKDIFEAQNDKFANQVIDEICLYLGLAYANIGNILNPDVIILGGGVSSAGNQLLNKVQHYFNKFAFSVVRNSTKITLASLGNDAGLIGSGLLVL